MGKKLIIVESPAKMKTLKKFLGPDYVFESSVGHIRDLPQKGFGIDVEHDFEPTYEVLPEKKGVVEKLIREAKKADMVYLSPDPDREGEAIAWHIAALLPKGTKIKRTAFNSITKDEVVRALQNPEEINLALVDAQQARRFLDRMVGYKISPILARKVAGGRRIEGGLSAGRVQSVALKLVVDREKEIEAFRPVEYWNLSAKLDHKGSEKPIVAHLLSVGGKRVEKEPIEGKEVALIPNEKTAAAIKAKLEKATYKVGAVERKEKRRNPVAPFITSTLQQEASRHFGFASSKTMSVAQTLYEGVDMGTEGTEGLITYMRTDSVRTAPEAISAVRTLIEKKFGKQYVPEQPKIYTSKKSAQDAHEAIRPTNLAHPPERVKKHLTRDQYFVYTLIWKRFVASQMAAAVYDTVSADIETNTDLVLRATGAIIKFKGFLALYEEKKEEEEEEAVQKLPELKEGESLKLQEVGMEQAFTRPPPRFTEASLVKELEKSGIGRPSTYAAIMNKIQSRSYTVKENKRLKPTELGRVCADLLERAFPKIMNVDFTANMEDDLELIAESKKEWKAVIREFWNDFLPTVLEAEKSAHVPKIDTDLPCPKCGKHLQKIWARQKYFYGCVGYPDCDYSAPIEEMSFDKSEYDPNFNWEQRCPICDSEMKVRHGRFGPFLGCTRYPECKGTVNIPKKGEEIPSADELPNCPAIGCPGKIQARRSRYGKIFFSCSTYPDCDVIVNKVEDLAKKYKDHPRTAYVKKAKGKGGRGKAALHALSKELIDVVGEKELSRGDVTKKLWEYIKANDLQDPKNKRLIVPDAKLTKLFGSSDPLDMFQLARVISRHLKK
ncbi:MAG: type I DNA topoisomerase [Parachlamydiales bacterium]